MATRKKIPKKKRGIKAKDKKFQKLNLLKWVFTFCLIGVLSRVFYLKSYFGETYEKEAIAQQMNAVIEKTTNANRGNILDRNQQSLAISSTVYNIVLDIKELMSTNVKDDARNNTLNGLSRILEIPRETLDEYVKIDPATKRPVNDTRYFIIAKGVDRLRMTEIEASRLTCVYGEEDTKRSYVHNNLAAQLIGFRRGDALLGLESYYNSELTGNPGRIFRVYDQNKVPTTQLVAAESGDTLVTTIDLVLQQYAEEGVKKWGNEYNAQNTSIIVMNPNTGEINAMASYPSFDLNDPMDVEAVTSETLKDELSELEQQEQIPRMNKIWNNFNVSDSFEPGSIFKPITVAMGLEEGVIDKDWVDYCPGGKKYPELTGVNAYGGLPCHLLSGHGTQTLTEAIANSCNVAMINIVEKLDKETFYKYQRDFGFAEKTGIDLPAETSAEALVFKLNQLNKIELATSSFGQGSTCTPIQAITAFAATINGGNLYKPYIVSQIIDNEGRVTKDVSPTLVRKVISQETSDYLRTAMESTLTIGTGRRAAIAGYSIGGKTGTAQQGNRDDKKYTLSFTAYLPVEKPEYLVQVLIHVPEDYVDGVHTPGYMMKEMLEKIITYKSIAPSYDPTDPTLNAEVKNSMIMPDYTDKSLEEVTRSLNDSLGLDYSLVGARGSTVASQTPLPGAVINEQTRPILFITAEEDEELMEVPDISRLNFEGAKAELERLGLNISVEEVEQEDSDGLVFYQFIEPRVKVVAGTYVKVKVSVPISEESSETEP